MASHDNSTDTVVGHRMSCRYVPSLASEIFSTRFEMTDDDYSSRTNTVHEQSPMNHCMQICGRCLQAYGPSSSDAPRAKLVRRRQPLSNEWKQLLSIN
jgi:hypothetical protein